MLPYFIGDLRSFLKNTWGVIQKPYQTYRVLVSELPSQLIFVFLLVALYFFLVSPIKLHTLHPFFLTLNATRMFTTTILTYLGIVTFFMIIGKLFGKPTKMESVMLAWGYSLLPTLVWFFATSLFYLLLPPPRHETLLGRTFSLLFLSFSLSLFFWKGILYYLTLRFALKFDLNKILITSLIFLPGLALYSYCMYKLGIFRVPFV